MSNPIYNKENTIQLSKYIDPSYIMIFIFIIIFSGIGVLLLYLSEINTITCIKDSKQAGICHFSTKNIFEYSLISRPTETIDALDWETGRKHTYNYLKMKNGEKIHLKMNLDRKVRKEIFAKFNTFLTDKTAKSFDFTDDKRPFFYPLVCAVFLFNLLLVIGFIQRLLILFYDFVFRS